MQCEIQRFNIIRHFIVPSTSIKRAKWFDWKVFALCCVAVFNMTKFVPNINKEHSRTAINFLFSFEENCCGIIPIILEKLMVNMFHCKKRVNDGFSVSKLEISMLQTRNTENCPKNTKTWNYKHCWMKMIHKHKNNSQSNWALVNKLFPIAYERWERFRKAADECHMNWTRDRWRRAKTHVKFYSNDTEESHSCIVSLLGMESGFFWESQAQKVMGRPRHTIHIDRKTESLWQEDDALWWDQKDVVYYELLKPGKTVNIKRYNNWSIWTVRCLKNEYQNTKRGNTRSFFSMTMLHHIW